YTSATKLTVLRQLRYLHRTNGNRENLVRGRNVRLRVGKIDIELRPSRSGGGAGGPGYRESFASRGQHQYRACGSPYGARSDRRFLRAIFWLLPRTDARDSANTAKSRIRVHRRSSRLHRD